jgi:hypothetical protein
MLYRLRDEGELVTKSELMELHNNVSFPRVDVFDDELCEWLEVDKVTPTEKPPRTLLQMPKLLGAIQTADGSWEESWGTEPVFDSPEEEAEIQRGLIASKWGSVRSVRTQKLAETDYLALSDAPTMSPEMVEYRKKLRDLPSKFDNPDDVVFPEKP